MEKPVKCICFYRPDKLQSPLPALCQGLECQVVELTREQELGVYGQCSDPILFLVAAQLLPKINGSLPSWLESLLDHHLVAIYDASELHYNPINLIHHGLRGVLYHSSKLDQSLTGIQTMLQGNLWFKRIHMEQALSELIKEHQQHQTPSDGRSLDKLTEREISIVRLVALGSSNKEIARQLFISEYTVKAHLASVFRKTETHTRAELVGKLASTQQ